MTQNSAYRLDMTDLEPSYCRGYLGAYTGWPDPLSPPGMEPFIFVRKLMPVFSYYAIFYDTLTKNL